MAAYVRVPVARHSCAAINCTNAYETTPNLSFHKFPMKDEERCKRWIIKLRRSELNEKDISCVKNLRLCDDHFEASQFMNPKLKNVHSKNKKLMPNAVPTIFKYSSSLLPAKDESSSLDEISVKNEPIEAYVGCSSEENPDQYSVRLLPAKDDSMSMDEIEIKNEPIEAYVDCSSEENPDQLIELEEERSKEFKAEEEVIPEAPKKFTAKKLAEAFATISRGIRMVEEMDVNYERFARTDRQIQDALACYREIYNEKKKQTVQSTLDIFLKKSKPSTSVDAPMPSTSYSRASSEEREIDPLDVASSSSSN